LNSPETPLFHKGKEVYGLYELLEKNSKPQRILIVEGYMDVIALAQFGIHYAVASLGTAASQAHLDLLFRFAPELVFCFDGDKAGREAAWRAMEPAFSSLKEGRQIRIMLLPQHHDPDSLVREEGVDSFVTRVQNAETLSDYFFGHVANDLNLSEMEGRAQLINKARPYLEKLPESIFKDMMFTRLKQLSGWGRLDVLENAATLVSNKVPNQAHKQGKKRPQDNARLSTARVAIALLVQSPRLAEIVEQQEIDWNGLEFPGAPLFKNILQLIAEKNPANTAVLLECYRNTAEEKSIKALALLDLQVSDDNIDTVFCDALNALLTRSRDACIAKLLDKDRSQGLSAQEKQLLRNMLTAK
jgi:DNA primase